MSRTRNLSSGDWRYWWRVLLSLMLAAWLAHTLPGAGVSSAPLPAQSQPSAHITVFVMDDSGSMIHDIDGVLAADPRALRCSAIRMFVDLAGPSDLFGLIRFPDAPRDNEVAMVIITPTLPYAAGVSGREALKRQIAGAGAGKYTPLADALDQAFYMLEAATRDRLGDFAACGWPIETRALGAAAKVSQDDPFHRLLGDTARGFTFQAVTTAAELESYLHGLRATRPFQRRADLHRILRAHVQGCPGRHRQDQVPDQRAGRRQEEVADRRVLGLL